VFYRGNLEKACRKSRPARPYNYKNIIYLFFIIIIIFNACGTPPVKETSTDINNNIKVRYVNIGIIFSYMVNKDPDTAALKKEREALQSAIEDIREKIDGADENVKQGLVKEMMEKQGSLAKLKNEEEYYKGRILNEINSAIEGMAKKDDIDFVLNIGEGAVYARKEYNMTERIIQEIENRARRNAPVSR
ncbi:MAG: OmpH family outer membrane protein, partial [Spirochaetes bacterium]|nr:OmpH family outer membrane protein [Spirochaetota bacterium]